MKHPAFLLFALITLLSSFAAAQGRGTGVAMNFSDDGFAGAVRSRTVAGTGSGAESTRTAMSVERSVFKLMNTARAAKGLNALTWSEEIAAVARAHSNNMAGEKFFSHRGSDGSMVNDRAFRRGLFNWSAIGENIAFLRGFENPEAAAVENWMNSPSHRKNLLSSNWTESAVGVAITADGTYYFTQVFLKD